MKATFRSIVLEMNVTLRTSLLIVFWFQGSEETVPDAGRKQILRMAGSDRQP